MVDAVEDIKTREEAKALLTFLYSEKRRHEKDIEMIHKAIRKVIRDFRISAKEYEEIKKRAERYIEF